jgi:CheY-like chemotaxis protein
MNSFPQSVAANHEPNSESAAPEQIPAKILVVDDESDLEILFRQMFRREIRKSEMSFAFVHNGQQALDKLALENDFDMVLSDIRMPQMDGLTLLAKLNKEYPTLKAVMVTAYGDMENIRRAMNGGAFDFISKPIQYHEATIEKTLNHVKELKELHRAREERIQAQARLVTELRKLDKMKDEFLANTSHELRTPLNGIIGIVESLLAEAASDKARANLELVLQSGKRLAHLVNEILDFAKLKNDGYSLRREPLRLDRTIRAVLQLSEPLAREKNLICRWWMAMSTAFSRSSTTWWAMRSSLPKRALFGLRRRLLAISCASVYEIRASVSPSKNRTRSSKHSAKGMARRTAVLTALAWG